MGRPYWGGGVPGPYSEDESSDELQNSLLNIYITVSY